MARRQRDCGEYGAGEGNEASAGTGQEDAGKTQDSRVKQSTRTADERPCENPIATEIIRPAARVAARTLGSPTVPAIRLRPSDPAAYANWDASGVATTP